MPSEPDDPDTESLQPLLAEIWRRLEAATRGGAWRTPVLATCAGDRPSARTVVLRAVDPHQRLLRFHTDARSAKVGELENRPRVEWVFHDPADGVQLRASGLTRLAAGTDNEWEALPAPTRRLYALPAAPGEPADATAAAAPADDGRAWFITGTTVVDCIHWHQISTEGNRAARFVWTDHEWRHERVVP